MASGISSIEDIIQNLINQRGQMERKEIWLRFTLQSFLSSNRSNERESSGMILLAELSISFLLHGQIIMNILRQSFDCE